MKKYVKVIDGLKSNVGDFEYRIDKINVANTWNPNTLEPKEMGGFNFSVEDKILRWLHRGNTIYDVIIPTDAEVILCDEVKGIYRANKIIISNPRPITDDLVMKFYKNTTLSNKIIAQCLKTLLWKNRLNISKFIINDRVNKGNVIEFIKEFEDYSVEDEFTYDKLGVIVADKENQISEGEEVLITIKPDESIDLGLTKFWGPEMNEIGNFSIGGHNYAIKRSPLFSKLKNLNKEDEFSLIDLKGRTVKYKIYQKSLVDPSDTSCIDQNIDGKREVTLITCEKGAKRRLVLKAREI